MAERMLTEAHWGYYAFVLPVDLVVEKGKLACFDTADDGNLANAADQVGLVNIGIWAESMTGDGIKRCQVKLHREVQATWWDNDGVAPVLATHRGQLCYLVDETTVSIDSTDRSVAGLILEVSTAKGVLVHFGYQSW